MTTRYSDRRRRRLNGSGGGSLQSFPGAARTPSIPTNMTWGDGTGVTWGDGTGVQWSGSPNYIGLTKWKTALANQALGIGRPKVVFIGDSVTFGAGSSGFVVSGDLITNNFTSQWTGLLNGNGLPAQCNNIMANGPNGLVTHSLNDPRFVKGSTWVTTNANTQSPGGYCLSHLSGSFDSCTATFSGVDTFRVWYPLIGSVTGPGGNLQMSVDGGAVTTQSVSSGTSSDGTPAYIDIPAGSVGTHTLSITSNSSNLSFFLAIEGFDSTSNQISVMNAGWSGAKASTWTLATYPWSPYNYMGSYGQDLTVIALGANDWINGVSIPTFQSQYDSLIQSALAAGTDVVLQTPVPTNPGISTSIQDQFVAVINQLAATYGLSVIDVYGYFGSYAIANSLGWMCDDVHPNALGYTAIANVINRVLGA